MRVSYPIVYHVKVNGAGTPWLTRHRTIVIMSSHYRAIDFFALFEESGNVLEVMIYLFTIKHSACLYLMKCTFNYAFR